MARKRSLHFGNAAIMSLRRKKTPTWSAMRSPEISCGPNGGTTPESATVELDPSLAEPSERIGGLNTAEIKIYLEEIEKLRQSQLTDRERQLIENALNSEGALARAEKDPREAGNLRVFLHRSRKKLARLAGWRK